LCSEGVWAIDKPKLLINTREQFFCFREAIELPLGNEVPNIINLFGVNFMKDWKFELQFFKTFRYLGTTGYTGVSLV